MIKVNGQRGFGTVEMILVVLLLIAIGAAGYFAYEARQAKSDSAVTKEVTTKDTKQTKSSDSYEGWKTYASSYTKASFRYPDTWTITAAMNGLAQNPEIKDVALTSPKGLKLTYRDALDGIGGGCPDTDPHVALKTVEELKNASGIYFIESDSLIALADSDSWPSKKAYPGDTGTCLFYPLIGSKSPNSAHISFSSSIQVRGGEGAALTTTATDLEEARLILKSFKF